MVKSQKTFSVDFESTKLVGDIMPATAQPNILVLHGAGNSNRARYDYLRLPLAKDGLSTCAFDMVGHGDTGGSLASSNLHDRTDQAKEVINKQMSDGPIGIIGGSMGGYTAVKLCEEHPVDRLVLVVPAAYTESAYDLNFDEEFSREIREKDSWRKSDAWRIIAKFTGQLLIVAAENDEVIPRAIPELLFESAVSAKQRKLIFIPGATHALNRFLADPANQTQFSEVYEKIRQTLS